MLDNIVREIATRFGLGDQAKTLVQMVLAYAINPATGGLSGLLDRFRSAGQGGLVQNWLGTTTGAPQEPSNSQVESLFGSAGGLLSTIVSKLGISREQATSAVGALVPLLVSRLTPGGTVPAALPAEVSAFAGEGRALLGGALSGVAGAATAATQTAAAAVSTASGGISKWLPWIIAALVVIFGINYCSKKPPVGEVPPAATSVPPPSAPAASAAAVTPAAPAPASTPIDPAADAFTAPLGAGVLDALRNDVPSLRVFFDSGKVDVAPEFAGKAKALVDYLNANADAKAVISGFNDPTGDPVKNAELSKKRAEAVQAALVAAGVPQDRTLLEKPADTTSTGGSNAESRRVDVLLRK